MPRPRRFVIGISLYGLSRPPPSRQPGNVRLMTSVCLSDIIFAIVTDDLMSRLLPCRCLPCDVPGRPLGRPPDAPTRISALRPPRPPTTAPAPASFRGTPPAPFSKQVFSESRSAFQGLPRITFRKRKPSFHFWNAYRDIPLKRKRHKGLNVTNGLREPILLRKCDPSGSILLRSAAAFHP